MHNQRFRILLAVIPAALLAVSCSDGTGPGFNLTITTTSLPPAVIGEAYAAGVDAEGGDGAYEWELVAGALPAGLELAVEGLTDDDLLVRGTPTRVDTDTFTVEVRSGDGQSATQQLSIRVVPRPIDNVAFPPGLVGYPYSVLLRAAGGLAVDRWELIEGTLPAGLTFSGTRIAGTPTEPDTARITMRLVADGITRENEFEIRVLPDRPGEYNISPLELAPVSAGIRPHLDAAVAEWERILTSDFESGTIGESQFEARVCGGFGEDVNGGALDDLLLLVNIDSIDGPGKVLGQAGPCLFQEDTLIPGAGILTLDEQDLQPLVGNVTLTYIIFHEIGHVLGFGGMWEPLELVDSLGTARPVFIGEQAVAEWQALGGEGRVPIETEGGEGTAEVHWKESVFNRERMTGFSEALGVAQPMSRVSVASMFDIGYEVDMSAADDFSLLPALRAHGETESAFWGTLGYDILYDGPVGTLGRRGGGTR